MENFCFCLEKIWDEVCALWLSSPEERRKRSFERQFAHMLDAGDLFVLRSCLKIKQGADVLGTVAATLFGSLEAPKESNAGEHEACGSQILVNLERASASLSWRSLELHQNKPKFQGSVHLRLIQKIELLNNKRISLKDHRAKEILCIESSDAATAVAWCRGLQEALIVLAPEIEEESNSQRSLLDQQQRYLELERRKREREKRKAQLGNVGMKFTAEAMMRQKT